MIGGAKVELGPMKAEELPPKNSSKDGIPVAYNRRWNSMQFENYLKEGLCHLGRGVRVLEGCKVTVFGEAIYNHKDGGSAIGRRQPVDKIYGYVRPHVLENGQGLQ